MSFYIFILLILFGLLFVSVLILYFCSNSKSKIVSGFDFDIKKFNSAEIACMSWGTSNEFSVSTMLFSLAQNGYLKIVALPPSFTYPYNFKFVKLKEYDGNNKYEQMLFYYLFTPNRRQIDISSYRNWPNETVLDEVVIKDLFGSFRKFLVKISKVINNDFGKIVKNSFFLKMRNIFCVLTVLLSFVLLWVMFNQILELFVAFMISLLTCIFLFYSLYYSSSVVADNIFSFLEIYYGCFIYAVVGVVGVVLNFDFFSVNYFILCLFFGLCSILFVCKVDVFSDYGKYVQCEIKKYKDNFLNVEYDVLINVGEIYDNFDKLYVIGALDKYIVNKKIIINFPVWFDSNGIVIDNFFFYTDKVVYYLSYNVAEAANKVSDYRNN